uniref:Uncharacterized protein n=1 Tax=viral metagenome TaxID=1070528 RepID=A0A2V0RC06_9ZZZZ
MFYCNFRVLDSYSTYIVIGATPSGGAYYCAVQEMAEAVVVSTTSKPAILFAECSDAAISFVIHLTRAPRCVSACRCARVQVHYICNHTCSGTALIAVVRVGNAACISEGRMSAENSYTLESIAEQYFSCRTDDGVSHLTSTRLTAGRTDCTAVAEWKVPNTSQSRWVFENCQESKAYPCR